MDATVVPMSTAVTDPAPPSISWPAMLNGAATASAITVATMNVSSRMPNTRQKLLRTSANDLVIASMTGSLSSTISTGANSATV